MNEKTMLKLDETTLLAYVDGQLDLNEAQEVKEALAGNPDAQELVNKLTATPAALRDVFDATLGRPLPPRFAQTIIQSKVGSPPGGKVRLIHASLAATVLFIVGIGVGYIAGVPQRINQDDWITAIVDYQVLYGRETVNRSDATAEQIQRIEQHLGYQLGRKLKIPDLSAFGLAFKRGQVLEQKDTPLVQLVYLPTSGKPIAYCITKTPEPDSAPTYGERKGLSFYQWRDGDYAHILVGATTTSRLQQLLTEILKTEALQKTTATW